MNLLREKSTQEAANIIRWEYNSTLRHYVLGACHYFTHLPDLPSSMEMSARMERCMWAETFKGKNPMPPKWLQKALVGMGPVYYEALKTIFYKPGSPVEKRLIALGIMADFKQKKRGNELKNFGHYTSDSELKQLIQWAYDYRPEVIGGPFGPEWGVPPGIMSNFRSWQMRAVC